MGEEVNMENSRGGLISGTTFRQQTDGAITGRTYNWQFTVCVLQASMVGFRARVLFFFFSEAYTRASTRVWIYLVLYCTASMASPRITSYRIASSQLWKRNWSSMNGLLNAMIEADCAWGKHTHTHVKSSHCHFIARYPQCLKTGLVQATQLQSLQSYHMASYRIDWSLDILLHDRKIFSMNWLVR